MTIVAAIVLVIFFLVEAPALVESGDVDRITVFGIGLRRANNSARLR